MFGSRRHPAGSSARDSRACRAAGVQRRRGSDVVGKGLDCHAAARGVSRQRDPLGQIPLHCQSVPFDIQHNRPTTSHDSPECKRHRGRSLSYSSRRSAAIQAFADLVTSFSASGTDCSGCCPGSGAASRRSTMRRRAWRLDATGASSFPASPGGAPSSASVPPPGCIRACQSSMWSRSTSSTSIRIARPTAADSSPRDSRSLSPQLRSASSFSSSRRTRSS
jgi:hypothetical protein